MTKQKFKWGGERKGAGRPPRFPKYVEMIGITITIPIKAKKEIKKVVDAELDRLMSDPRFM